MEPNEVCYKKEKCKNNDCFCLELIVTIVAIALAAVLMFVFPLMTMSERTDDISQLVVSTATTEFVDEIRTTGKITPEKYIPLPGLQKTFLAAVHR